MELTPPEARVVGCLIEKQLTTPQYYPLTLNALVAACNQTSNRHPVVSYDAATVENALASLREKGVTRIVYSVHNRAARYRHVLDEVLGLDPKQAAVIGVLLLRGPQTLGEIRSRTERMAEFDDLGDVEATLECLWARPEPLVTRLERQPGHKEARFAHLLADGSALPDAPAPSGVTPARSGRAGAERLEELAEEVRSLRRELDDLRAELAELRRILE